MRYLFDMMWLEAMWEENDNDRYLVCWARVLTPLACERVVALLTTPSSFVPSEDWQTKNSRYFPTKWWT